ncbi:F-box domain-containing protein [Mycena sanguinolenta]|uniref:F-box domain-containing protein n=1 Tax=Mycena sanguinolenta TaxID=230812 RepID=A0A8H6Z163_9AGAR|nr:F-box domain-containing protein [Mycena sanguinolenta]
MNPQKCSQIQDAYRVSHVCRHWRQVAIDTRRLWTAPLEVALPRYRRPAPGDDGVEAYVDGLRAWLARSEPLSIPIHITGLDNESWGTDSGSRVTNALLQSASRWRSLRFAPFAPGWLLQRLIGRLDSLEELELRRTVGDNSIPLAPATILCFTVAPCLHKLTINPDPDIRPLPIPWVQLTDITLTAAISCEVFLDMFSHCINVVRASVIITGSSPRAAAGVLALDHLQVLSVSWATSHADFGMRFLDYFSAPALDKLHLRFMFKQDTKWREATFAAFQGRSPNITKLKISGSGLSMKSDALIVTLQHAPSLTHLSVDDCCGTIDDVLLGALRFTDEVEPLVPHLHSLTLAISKPGFSHEKPLANLIASRWWTDADLMLRSEALIVHRWRQIKLRDDSNHSRRDSGFKPGPKFRDRMKELQQTDLAVDLVQYSSWKSEGEVW